MPQYKTVVTDYEGMQGALDTHAAQGWRLFSIAPDTWRKTVAADSGMEAPPFDDLEMQPVQEYSASYYLLVFARDEPREKRPRAAALQEALPREARPPYEE